MISEGLICWLFKSVHTVSLSCIIYSVIVCVSEFDEAFQVFCKDGNYISRDDLPHFLRYTLFAS